MNQFALQRNWREQGDKIKFSYTCGTCDTCGSSEGKREAEAEAEAKRTAEPKADCRYQKGLKNILACLNNQLKELLINNKPSQFDRQQEREKEKEKGERKGEGKGERKEAAEVRKCYRI